MFVTRFRHRHRSQKYKDFKARYESFHPDDIIVLCDWHHAEVHELYLKTIKFQCEKLALPLYAWTWKQAEILMKDLRNICAKWVVQESPGVDPKWFDDQNK